MRKWIAAVVILAMALPMSVFADHERRDKTRNGAIIGAVAGGVLGAVIGNNRGSGDAKKGAVVGAVAGTAIGAGIGAYMDKQERELRRIEGLEVHRTDEDELNVVVKNEILFDFDSAALRSGSRSTISEMAEVFRKYNDTTIGVEGHTDSTGAAAYNQRLSVRRASGVANYLEDLRIDGSRLDTI
ncbi:MAG TPA: OmpA family protein, partial [Thermoanaerobaculia bacterium]